MAEDQDVNVGEVDDENFVVDMSDVEEFKFENIPQGTYDVVISGVEYKRSQASNKPMWEMSLEIINNEEFQGRKLRFWASFSEKALPGTKTMIMNIKPDLLEAPLKPKEVADEGILIGLTCKAKVVFDMYDNPTTGKKEKRSKIQYLLAGASEGANEFMAG